jgi:hypothetical protein
MKKQPNTHVFLNEIDDKQRINSGGYNEENNNNGGGLNPQPAPKRTDFDVVNLKRSGLELIIDECQDQLEIIQSNYDEALFIWPEDVDLLNDVYEKVIAFWTNRKNGITAKLIHANAYLINVKSPKH